jgi:hypothetical protein
MILLAKARPWRRRRHSPPFGRAGSSRSEATAAVFDFSASERLRYKARHGPRCQVTAHRALDVSDVRAASRRLRSSDGPGGVALLDLTEERPAGIGDLEGATNWFSTSFNPAMGLYYVQTLEKCTVYTKTPGE